MSRFRHTTVIVGLLIAAIIFASCEKEVIAVDPEEISFTSENLAEDYNYFLATMKKYHPNLTRESTSLEPHTRRMYNTIYRLDSQTQQINRSMSLLEFYTFIRQASALIQCGHTRLWIGSEFWKGIKQYKKHFPLQVYYRDYKAYALEDFSNEQAIPAGSEIVTINGQQMLFLIEHFRSIIGADGVNVQYKTAEMNRLPFGLFPGSIAFPQSYEVSYIIPGDSIESMTHISALPYMEILRRQKEVHPQDSPWPPYVFDIIDDSVAAIITIPDFVSAYDYKNKIAESFEIIRDKGISHLIIDVRGNDGGDPYVAAELLNHIIDSAYIYFSHNVYGYGDLKDRIEPESPNFNGDLYVLADGGGFSTTGHFLSLIRYYDLGVIIGDTSGGSYICNGCYDEITLPHTKISVMYPRCRYATAVTGFDEFRGIAPDTIIKPTIGDIINDRDPVMDYVLERINGKDIQ
ncbi:MAG: S41 family peptidase [Candidatus Zixiibacteriota bacterium]